MLCAISGEAPQVPVVSRKSGLLYEKRLIEAYISENGTEPSTNESLATDDLIDVKGAKTVRPRPPTLTSIPSLLGVFQEEWDALALETHTLKQNLAQTRQELSTALYQHDAAVRVIARLTRERDEAREALSKISVGRRTATENGDAMQVDNAGLSDAVIARVEATQERLSKTRRKRPVPDDWATSEDISTFQERGDPDVVHAKPSSLSLDQPGDLALIGGAEGNAGIYSLSKRTILASLKGGSGAITDGVWAGSRAIVSTSTGKVKIFSDGQESSSFDVHAGKATALALHPSGDLLASAGVDKSYVVYDLLTNTTVTQIFSDSGLTTLQFHPDGHLLAAGGLDGQIKIFDVRSGSLAATFQCSGPLQALRFSENGTWLASVVTGSSSVSIWDLRKSVEIKVLATRGRIDSLDWDYTGQFLLTGGPEGLTVQQYSKTSKEWSEPMANAVVASAVAWGPAARSAVAVDDAGAVKVLIPA